MAKVGCHAVNPQTLELAPFVKHLCGMDSRIRVCAFYGDVEEDKGFFVTKSNVFIPYVLPKIEHEIAHLVELRNPKRWTMKDWGMPRFEKDTIKRNVFFAALSREVRTRAIQLHMQPNSIGNEKDSAYNQLANSYWADMAGRLFPYGRFKSMQDLKCWMDDLRERTYRAWSLDRIEQEWKFRLNHISHWMETSP